MSPRFWILAGSLMCAPLAAAEQPPPEPARQQALVHMVIQDCGSCHGLTLKGGLGPSLLPAALAGKPPEGLAATIYYGRPATAMPPFRSLLSEAEANWIVEQLLLGFPKEQGPRP